MDDLVEALNYCFDNFNTLCMVATFLSKCIAENEWVILFSDIRLSNNNDDFFDEDFYVTCPKKDIAQDLLYAQKGDRFLITIDKYAELADAEKMCKPSKRKKWFK